MEKIAVTYEHFSALDRNIPRSMIADGKVVNAEVVDTNGSGHGALAGFLVAAWQIPDLRRIGGGAGMHLPGWNPSFRRSFRKMARSCKRTACRKSWL